MAGVDLSEHAETAYDFGVIHLGHAIGGAVTGAESGQDREAEPVTGAR